MIVLCYVMYPIRNPKYVQTINPITARWIDLYCFPFLHLLLINVWQLSCRKSYGLKGNDGIGAPHDIIKPKLANWKNRCNAQLILHHGRVLIRTEPIKTSEIRI